LNNSGFKELAGTKPLSVLAKKVPIFNRRDEIVRALCEFEVPVNRGVWLIKMTAAYAAAMQVIQSILVNNMIIFPQYLQIFKCFLSCFLRPELGKNL